MNLHDVWKEKPHSLSIVVVAYNELDNLGTVWSEILAEVERIRRPCEIIIVDDGSTDGMEKLADELVRNVDHARVIHHEGNQGIGQVFSTGFREARNDLVIFLPADGQYPADIISDFLPHMDDHDLVMGYVPKRTSPRMAKILSGAERLLLNVLFGRLPRFQGVYMLRRSILRLFPLTSRGRGWIIQMELIIRAKRAGCRLTSVPTHMRPRLSGESKARSLKSVIANSRQVLVLFWRLTMERLRG